MSTLIACPSMIVSSNFGAFLGGLILSMYSLGKYPGSGLWWMSVSCLRNGFRQLRRVQLGAENTALQIVLLLVVPERPVAGPQDSCRFRSHPSSLRQRSLQIAALRPGHHLLNVDPFLGILHARRLRKRVSPLRAHPL